MSVQKDDYFQLAYSIFDKLCHGKEIDYIIEDLDDDERKAIYEICEENGSTWYEMWTA